MLLIRGVASRLFLVFVVLIACAQPGITDELAPGAKRIPIIVYTRMAPGPDEDGPGRMLLELVEEGKTIRVYWWVLILIWSRRTSCQPVT